jgi:hypothetical protein
MVLLIIEHLISKAVLLLSNEGIPCRDSLLAIRQHSWFVITYISILAYRYAALFKYLNVGTGSNAALILNIATFSIISEYEIFR